VKHDEFDRPPPTDHVQRLERRIEQEDVFEDPSPPGDA
jgi:hypothetical protein